MPVNVGHLEATLGLNNLGLMTGLAQAQAAMRRAGASMKAIGRSMSMAISLPLTVLGVAAVITFAKFEQAMNQVKAIVQGTTEEMARMTKQARLLGSTTKFTATQAAGGMNFLAMAGFSVNEVMTAMPTVLSLAAAGAMELADAADHVSNIMRGFRLEASATEVVADILTATFTSSNTSLLQLGEAMSYAAPVMRAFRQGIETTAAAIGFLSDAGIQSSRAGTGLRQIFTQLVRKNDELGISITGIDGKFLDLADILAQIERQGLTTMEVFSIMGPRAGTAMAVLMERGSEALRNYAIEVASMGGITKRVADIQMEGLAGAFIELKSAVQELAISFSEILGGALEALTDKIKVMVIGWSRLDTSTKKVIIALGLIALAAGPVIWVLGMIATLIGAITWPVLAVVAAIAVLGAAFIYVADNWEAIIERISDWNWWRNMLISMAQFLIKWHPAALIWKGFQLLLPFMLNAWNKLKELIGDIDWWKNMLIKMVAFFIKWNPFSRMAKDIAWLTGKVIPALADTYESVMENMEDEASDFDWGNFLLNPFEAMSDGLEGLKGETKAYEHEFGSFTEALRNAANKARDAIAGMFPSGGGGGGGVVETQTQGATSIAEEILPDNNFIRPWSIPIIKDLEIHVERMKKLQKMDTTNWANWQVMLRDIWTNISNDARISFKQLTAVIGEAIDISATLGEGLASVFAGIGESIGQALAGVDDQFASPLQRVLLIIADFASQMGKMLIGIGTFMLLSGIFAGAGVGIIAAGIGLVAIGSFASALINKKINANREAAGGGLAARRNPEGLASGGFVMQGGLFQLHKDELVSLPMGSAVTPANMVKGGAQGPIEIIGTLEGEVIHFANKEYLERVKNTRG